MWFWQSDRITSYHLDRDGEYQQQNKSMILPNLDVLLLASYVNAPNPRAAVIEFKDKI